MFTGIVTDVGEVIGADQRADLRLRIRTAYDAASIDLGASVCCSGVCLTVVDRGGDWFEVDLSTETLSVTANSLWKQGSGINLERSLRVGDELGGHFVTGHIDCVGNVVAVSPEGGSTRITVSVPTQHAALVAAKGSIALDGASLTVNDVREGDDGTIHFSVNIIPHTAEHTTLRDFAEGRQLNVEFDVLARYIDRMIEARSH